MVTFVAVATMTNFRNTLTILCKQGYKNRPVDCPCSLDKTCRKMLLAFATMAVAVVVCVGTRFVDQTGEDMGLQYGLLGAREDTTGS